MFPQEARPVDCNYRNSTLSNRLPCERSEIVVETQFRCRGLARCGNDGLVWLLADQKLAVAESHDAIQLVSDNLNVEMEAHVATGAEGADQIHRLLRARRNAQPAVESRTIFAIAICDNRAERQRHRMSVTFSGALIVAADESYCLYRFNPLQLARADWNFSALA